MARPREFDSDTVLDQAMEVFWRKGFEGTSMSDLLAATHLSKQSLYGAFGNKQKVYLAALEKYESTQLRAATELLERDGSAKDRVGALLQTAIDAPCKRSDRRGCMICNAAVDRAALESETRSTVQRCVGRLEAGIADALAGTAPYDDDKTARRIRARALLAAYFGLNVMAKAGAARPVLEDVRDAALETI